MKKVSSCLLLFCLAGLVSGSLIGAIPPIRIMPLGDSLTSGNYVPTPPEVLEEGGYRRNLYALLIGAGYNVDFIGNLEVLSNHPDLPDPDHEGHGGFQVHEVDAGIESWFATVDEPDVILLLIGTNDYSSSSDPDHTKDRFENLIEHIARLRPHAKIIVSNLPLRTDDPLKDDAAVTGFNLFVPEIVERQVLLGRQVSYIDLRRPPPLCCNLEDMADSLHPSPAGYDKMAETWFEGITAVIGPTDTAFRQLFVNSVNPSSGISVTVNPADADGAKNGLTAFSRTYPNGAAVSLTVPASVGASNFQKWQRNGVDYSVTRATTVTMNSSCTMTAVYSPVPLAPVNVTEAENYSLVYSLNLPNQANYNTTGVPYELDNRASVGAFNRIGYYLELQKSGEPVQYLWVSMNAFTSDVNKIGVPSAQTGAFLRQNVTSMNVQSSMPAIASAVGLTGGNIEFWPGSYTAGNTASVPGASDTLYDWGDHSVAGQSGYGSMQVHNYANGQTLFAFNGWGRTGQYLVDLGLGNYSGTNPDWTFAQNASSYVYKKLQVYVANVAPPRVLTVNSSNPATGVNVTVSPTDTLGDGSGTTPFTRSYANGTVVNLTAPASADGNTFLKWQRNGVDYGTGAAIDVTMTADDTLTAVYASEVVGAHVFYNNSAWDGEDVAANASDDNAIAPDKTPLLPGGIATFANYTSYSRGLNGIMIDVSSLPGTPLAADFTFKMGNDNTPGAWDPAPTPASVAVRSGAGVAGSDRISVTWADNAVKKLWLQVTVLATERTGLGAPYVFYFGNAMGETGTFPEEAKVDAVDQLGARANQRTLLNPAPIDFAFDFDRDKRVDAVDQLIARANQTTALNDLNLIDLSGVGLTALTADPDLRLRDGPQSRLSIESSAIRAVTGSLAPGLGGLSIQLDASEGLVLHFVSDASQPYRLQSTESLGVGSWKDIEVSTPVVRQGLSHWAVRVVGETSHKFFRIIPVSDQY